MASSAITTLLTLTVLVCLFNGGVAIKWVRFSVPNYVSRGENAVLTCQFDLEGEKLYSVKWYKGGREFYRYVPGEWPSQQAFATVGISVDMAKSDHQSVTLQDVTLDAKGRYKCEVLTEAPLFKTLVKSGGMDIVELPQEGPQVTGGLSEYRIGDSVNLTCTAPKSIPAASLSWLINGESAPQDYLIKYPVKEDYHGLRQAKLGLLFRAERWHFEGDHVNLRCKATIKRLYSKEGQHSGLVVHPLQPALLEDHTAGGKITSPPAELLLSLVISFLLLL